MICGAWLELRDDGSHLLRFYALKASKDDPNHIQLFTTLSQARQSQSRELIMANFLASIFGTELDKVNCSFYFVSSPSIQAFAQTRDDRQNCRNEPPMKFTDIFASSTRKSEPVVMAIAVRVNTSSRLTARPSSCPTSTRTQHMTRRIE